MQNELDPTDWEGCYRDGATPWEKGSPAPPLLEYLERSEIGGRVLVPGCGLGHDVRALATANSNAGVIGVDISTLALEQAENFDKVGSESYLNANLFDLPAELCGTFDLIFEHTCLSALPPELRQPYVEAFQSALKPGGQVLAIFFLTPWDQGETPEPPPYGINTDELDSMFAGHFQLEREWLPGRHYPGREGRELCRLLRKISED